MGRVDTPFSAIFFCGSPWSPSGVDSDSDLGVVGALEGRSACFQGLQASNDSCPDFWGLGQGFAPGVGEDIPPLPGNGEEEWTPAPDSQKETLFGSQHVKRIKKTFAIIERMSPCQRSW